MERYYDLNGREKCITAVITIGEETFRISRVVIAARVLYSNHIKEMGDLLQRLSKLETRDADTEEARRLTAEADEFARRKLELYGKIIRLLLEKNGYTYDAEWWKENTDELDMRSFIEKCLMKDTPADGNKKKETAAR